MILLLYHVEFDVILAAAEVLKLALDATPSQNDEKMWDTPAAATTWLKTFAINNEALLKETDVRIGCDDHRRAAAFRSSSARDSRTNGVDENPHPLVRTFSISLPT